jgi:hypothetical protein
MDPRDNREMYGSLAKQKIRQQGYQRIEGLIPKKNFVEHGFKVNKFGKCPPNIEEMLKHRYIQL